jgi:hypothetical protein
MFNPFGTQSQQIPNSRNNTISLNTLFGNKTRKNNQKNVISGFKLFQDKYKSELDKLFEETYTINNSEFNYTIENFSYNIPKNNVKLTKMSRTIEKLKKYKSLLENLLSAKNKIPINYQSIPDNNSLKKNNAKSLANRVSTYTGQIDIILQKINSNITNIDNIQTDFIEKYNSGLDNFVIFNDSFSFNKLNSNTTDEIYLNRCKEYLDNLKSKKDLLDTQKENLLKYYTLIDVANNKKEDKFNNLVLKITNSIARITTDVPIKLLESSVYSYIVFLTEKTQKLDIIKKELKIEKTNITRLINQTNLNTSEQTVNKLNINAIKESFNKIKTHIQNGTLLNNELNNEQTKIKEKLRTLKDSYSELLRNLNLNNINSKLTNLNVSNLKNNNISGTIKTKISTIISQQLQPKIQKYNTLKVSLKKSLQDILTLIASIKRNTNKTQELSKLVGNNSLKTLKNKIIEIKTSFNENIKPQNEIIRSLQELQGLINTSSSSNDRKNSPITVPKSGHIGSIINKNLSVSKGFMKGTETIKKSELLTLLQDKKAMLTKKGFNTTTVNGQISKVRNRNNTNGIKLGTSRNTGRTIVTGGSKK